MCLPVASVQMTDFAGIVEDVEVEGEAVNWIGV